MEKATMSALFFLSTLLLGASSSSPLVLRRPFPLPRHLLPPLPLHFLRPMSGSGGHPVEGLSCQSWRLAVETNNLREWKTVPAECGDYVGHYMLGHLYRKDSKVVTDEAFKYATNVTLGGDGKDIWIFDIDETTLSNLPYYARNGFGEEIHRRNTDQILFETLPEDPRTARSSLSREDIRERDIHATVPASLSLMSNLTKLEFAALDVSGKNYLTWRLDAKLHLRSLRLVDAIDRPTDKEPLCPEDNAKATIFLRRHLHVDLKNEYLTVEDPKILWDSLRDRYDHQRAVILPAARNEWINLRYQDFKSVAEYNSAMFNIASRLELCGEPVTQGQMIDKTLSTFHATNVILQQQYRERHFQKISDLISVLLVAEENNKILMKNHHSRPTGTLALPEAHASETSRRGRGKGRFNRGGRPNHSGRSSRGGDPRRGSYRGRGGRGNPHRGGFKPEHRHNTGRQKNKQSSNNTCYKCGREGHWSRTCRASKEEVAKFQKAQKAEANALLDVENDDLLGDELTATQLVASDFYGDNKEEAGNF